MKGSPPEGGPFVALLPHPGHAVGMDRGVSPIGLVEPSDAYRREFLAAVRRSKDLHDPWIQAPATDQEFSQYLLRLERSDHVGYFLVVEGGLAGVININSVVMGSLCSGSLGFYAFAGFDGQGLMTLGLRLVLREAFGRLGLHRVEANIQPANVRSIRLVQRLSFTREGFSERYLRVAGEWRDHQRWALLAERFDDALGRTEVRFGGRRLSPSGTTASSDGDEMSAQSEK
jgi:[ribosomal protein S5]-alanine N-acetyltransferase